MPSSARPGALIGVLADNDLFDIKAGSRSMSCRFMMSIQAPMPASVTSACQRPSFMLAITSGGILMKLAVEARTAVWSLLAMAVAFGDGLAESLRRCRVGIRPLAGCRVDDDW